MEYFLAIVSVGIILFIVLHLRPLKDHEVRTLGEKRRKQTVDAYFHVDSTELTVNPVFKKSLNPRGVFYRVDLPLYSVASSMAGLLKYKKHEWIVVAFEKQKQVNHLWVNKGHNNSSASIHLSVDQVLETALENGYSSVLMFHNHPNPNPKRYSCNQPSKTDLDTALLWASTLNPRGINLVKYICERGHHYRYSFSPSESFMPLGHFTDIINKVNGCSKLGNFQLHMERVF